MIEKLRELKKRSHMTNQQIAEKSNIPESTVARIFSGKTPNPTVSTVIAMARAMGASPADLLYDEDDGRAKDSAADKTRSDSKENTSVADAQIAASAEDKRSSRAEQGGNVTLPPEMLSYEDVASLEKFYEDIINLYKSEMKKKDVWIARLFWCLAGVMFFILFILIFDITHPGFGFVKY